jgi:hypothetical protein
VAAQPAGLWRGALAVGDGRGGVGRWRSGGGAGKARRRRSERLLVCACVRVCVCVVCIRMNHYIFFVFFYALSCARSTTLGKEKYIFFSKFFAECRLARHSAKNIRWPSGAFQIFLFCFAECQIGSTWQSTYVPKSLYFYIFFKILCLVAPGQALGKRARNFLKFFPWHTHTM